MKLPPILLKFVALNVAITTTAPAITPEEADGEFYLRIISGKPAKSGQFPYQVSLRYVYNKRHICGGSIINKNWVITAAHCLDYVKKPSELYITAGCDKLSEATSLNRYNASRVVRHWAYFSIFLFNDVALVRSASPFNFGKAVAPIAMSRTVIGGGIFAVFSGWGFVAYPKLVATDHLMHVDLITVDNLLCNARLLWPVLPAQLCTYTTYGQGICMGDSGGPLVVGGELVGVASFARSCARGYPDGFTRISAYVDWIRSEIDAQ